ncbi:MAG TPA: DUF883 family protein [Paucimonas sp.]|nr:DUF883 family protein [Paucimonas sp.]HJW55136.1 DUF883 family protein [Burkholderiaceae bacterium]
MDKMQQISETRDKLTENLKSVIKDAENLLRNTGQQTSESYQSAKARFESTLQSAKGGLDHMEESVIARTREAAQTTDQYVQEHPWKSVGLGALAGLVVGLLAGRK